MSKINTLIIGLGDIGSGFSKLYKHERNHAESVIKNKNFKLLCGIDKNKKKRDFFKKKFNTEVFKSIKDVPNKDKISFVIISTNTRSHKKNIEDILKFKNLQYILCEKPFCENLHQALKIQKTLIKKKVKLFINYFRRCLPLIRNIQKFIKNDDLKVVKIYYPKTLINNGSHFLDIIFFLFNLETYKLIKKKNFFEIKYKNKNFKFYEIKNKNSDAKVIFQKKNSQLVWIRNILKYSLMNNKIVKKLEFKNIYNQRYVLRSLFDKIKKKNSSLASIKDGIKVHKLIDKINIELKINE